MFPICFKGNQVVKAWPTVNDPTSIVVDSENVLRKGLTYSKTFNHELQIFQSKPYIVFSQKVKDTLFYPSLNHLQQWNQILVVSGDPIDNEQVDDKNKEKGTDQDSDSPKITITLYSDETPFEKVQSFQVEQEHFEFATVANDRRKDQTSVLLALATENENGTAAKLVRLEANSDSTWTHTIHKVDNPSEHAIVLLNTLIQ